MLTVFNPILSEFVQINRKSTYLMLRICCFHPLSLFLILHHFYTCFVSVPNGYSTPSFHYRYLLLFVPLLYLFKMFTFAYSFFQSYISYFHFALSSLFLLYFSSLSLHLLIFTSSYLPSLTFPIPPFRYTCNFILSFLYYLLPPDFLSSLCTLFFILCLSYRPTLIFPPFHESSFFSNFPA